MPDSAFSASSSWPRCLPVYVSMGLSRATDPSRATSGRWFGMSPCKGRLPLNATKISVSASSQMISAAGEQHLSLGEEQALPGQVAFLHVHALEAHLDISTSPTGSHLVTKHAPSTNAPDQLCRLPRNNQEDLKGRPQLQQQT
jgi:hypothetical protein